MKKIYINGRFLSQQITGVQRYAEEIIKAIDAQINNEQNYKWILLTPKNTIRNIKLENIELKKIGYLKSHLWEQIELPFYCKDGVLLNFTGCAPIIKKNQIITIHDAAVCVMPKSFSFAFRSWYKIMFNIVGRRAKRILTVSEFSKKEISKYFNIPFDKIDVTYNGIDHILRINPDETVFCKFGIERNNYVLAVSSLNPSKNFKLILEAAKQLKNINFVIAGGSNVNVFKEQGFEITSNVKFIGYIKDEELISLYKYATCFVYPSIYEGFGIPPIEAMYCRCPVIVSNIEVLSEVCGKGALYCDIKNADILTNKIQQIYNNIINIDKLIEEGKKNIKKYKWDNAAKKIINFFR